MIEIISHTNNKRIAYEHFIFGGGEQHIKINFDGHIIVTGATIWLHYSQDSDIWKLALIVDALRRSNVHNLDLNIPYFPAARQDRVCVWGEPLTVKVFADFINAMKFNVVSIFDPHSEVTPALLDNVNVIDNVKFVSSVLGEFNALDGTGKTVLVSPDAGSNKKVASVAKHLYKISNQEINVVRADKLRNVATGEIIETTVYADDLTGKNCYIIDDICSRGGTFCALAKVLKSKGANKVTLIVSHYEGTANMRMLKESGIDEVVTTNSKPFSMNDVAPNDHSLIIKDIKAFM
jgi:ribose-phosphate pyrophosphokinase